MFTKSRELNKALESIEYCQNHMGQT